MKFAKNENFIQTFTGKAFHFLAPDPDEICIEDIAHALSMNCRYTGHTDYFYSVAQHCCIMAEKAPIGVKLQALLHDAPEAYTGDMSKPIKVLIPQFEKIERKIWKAIASKYFLPIRLDPWIKSADAIMLATERRDLMKVQPKPWKIDAEGIKPFDQKIEPWPILQSKKTFLNYFRALNKL